MSSSQLELIRLNHELCEKYEYAVGDELDVKPNGVSPCFDRTSMMHLTNVLCVDLAKGEGLATTQVEGTD